MPRLQNSEVNSADFVTKYEQAGVACIISTPSSHHKSEHGAVDGWRSTVSDSQPRSRTVLSICSDIFSQHRRCALLREHGWLVLGSSSGHGGIVQFAAELVDVVVLDVDGDGAGTAVIAGALKRTKGKVPLILLVGEGQALVEGALYCADAVVARFDESELLQALEQQAGPPAHAARPA